MRSFSGRQNAVGSEGVLLYGIVHGDAAGLPRSQGVDVVSLRDLAALVARVPYQRVDATSAAILDYRARIETVFGDRPIVPAPFGTVFRSRDALVRWMELHYVALADGLEFVQNRASARVRLVAAADAATPEFEAAVFDSLKILKRHAVACVTLPEDVDRGPRAADASFLVERERWSAFSDAVRDEQERTPAVHIEQSGPWPAYDFVRLQFGG